MPYRLTGKELANLAVTSVQLTASVTTVATSSGAATALVTLPNAFYEGGDYLVYLDAPFITKGTTNINIEVWVDGVFSVTMSGVVTVSTVVPGSVLTSKVTLSAGNHVITLRGFVDAGTGTLGAGTGATGQVPPAFCWVTSI
jgi:hypothetical protein